MIKDIKNKKVGFKAVDILLIVLMIIPLITGMFLKVIFTPLTDDISISGALIYFTLSMPWGELPITESQINSWLVMMSIFWLCIFMTHGIAKNGSGIRQSIAEWIIEKTDKLVKENMGDMFEGFSPFVGAVLALSGFSSLLSLLGLYPPTSDLNVVAGWAILVFILITHYKLKCGPLQYLKSFTQPVAFLTPLNVISEAATPVSMAFRHYGNVLSGSVISVLIATALDGLSKIVFGMLPGVLGEIPFFRIGLPAVLSVYFDVFSGLLQAFIFAMLTMLYVASGFSAELYNERKNNKKNKNKTKNKIKN